MVGVLLKIVIFAYAATGIITTIGYLPTIIDLIKKKQSANINSYIIWTLCALSSFLYALLIVSDLLLELMTGLNFACCFIILILAANLKYNQKKKRK